MPRARLRGGISTPSSEPISDFSVSVESKQAKYGGLHCLRHWYASWLLNKKEAGGLGIPALTVSRRLGHNDVATTMRIYAHCFESEHDHAEMAAGENALLGIGWDNMGQKIQIV